ncbi:TlpA disulfide reductase family protein [Pinibacter aurantiacus]|uniref:AhpC/TSA family protein n=1 Tax=Pinibacter aurantiacus TaxID=2851599 RepID=A0A9E2W199_9BACT|nr:TlpA disulfide reductase family protein [Pinibacter aurantiacus]MBV4355875.1 AhpC/TSA family protein [Pinibacter aurantiacus]
MKPIILCFTLTLSASAFAQSKSKPFILNGSISNGKSDTAIISYTNAEGKYVHESSLIKNNKFSFKGKVEEPGSASLVFRTKGQVIDETKKEREKDVRIFIEPATMSVAVNLTDLAHPKMTGSKTQKEYEAYEASIEPVNQKIRTLQKQLADEKDSVARKAIKSQMSSYSAQTSDLTFDFIAKHPDSYISVYMFAFYGQLKPFDTTKKVFASLSPAMQQTRIGTMIHKQITAIEASSPGKAVDNFTSTDINGKQLSFADFKGKYLIIDFWASWCVPCRKSHPHLRTIFEKYKSKGLEIIGVADDDIRPQTWRKAVAQDSIGIWHHILSGSDQDKKMKGISNPDDLMERFGVTGLPTKFIVDPNGKILAKFIGDDAEGIDNELKKIFNY